MDSDSSSDPSEPESDLYRIPSPRPTIRTRYGYRVLHGTSQGRIFDLPPQDWIAAELIKYGVHRVSGKVKPPSLCGPAHPVFARERWQDIGDKTYELLLPSCYLATKLLKLSGAAFASFLPHFKQNMRRRVRASAVPLDDVSPDEATKSAIDDALKFFDEWAPKSVTWCFDATMAKRHHWIGINAPYIHNPPFNPAEPEEWRTSDKKEGLRSGDRRKIKIGMCAFFIDALQKAEYDSQKYLFAVVGAAINMVHELGHWLQTSLVQTATTPSDSEPFFADGTDMEIGDAYTGWLFGGFIPEELVMKDDRILFEDGVCWKPTLNCMDTYPKFITRYACSIDFLERLCTEDEWQSFGKLMDSNPGFVRKCLLFPPKFRLFQTARTAKLYEFGRMERVKDLATRKTVAEKGYNRFVNLKATPFKYVDWHWIEHRKSLAKATSAMSSNRDLAVAVCDAIRTQMKNLDNLMGLQQDLEWQKSTDTGWQDRYARAASVAQQMERDNPEATEEQKAAWQRPIDHISQAENHRQQDLVTKLQENQGKQSEVNQNLLNEVSRLVTMIDPNPNKDSSLGKSEVVQKPKDGKDAGRDVGKVKGRDAGKVSTSSSSSDYSAGGGVVETLPPIPNLSDLPQDFQDAIAKIKDMKKHPEKYPDPRPEVDQGWFDDHDQGLVSVFADIGSDGDYYGSYGYADEDENENEDEPMDHEAVYAAIRASTTERFRNWLRSLKAAKVSGTPRPPPWHFESFWGMGIFLVPIIRAESLELEDVIDSLDAGGDPNQYFIRLASSRRAPGPARSGFNLASGSTAVEQARLGAVATALGTQPGTSPKKTVTKRPQTETSGSSDEQRTSKVIKQRKTDSAATASRSASPTKRTSRSPTKPPSRSLTTAAVDAANLHTGIDKGEGDNNNGNVEESALKAGKGKPRATSKGKGKSK